MIINSHFVRLMKRENMHYLGQMKRLKMYITQDDLSYTEDIKMMMVNISRQRDNVLFFYFSIYNFLYFKFSANNALIEFDTIIASYK